MGNSQARCPEAIIERALRSYYSTQPAGGANELGVDLVPRKSESQDDHKPKEMLGLYTAEQLQEFGLGRGVDGTNDRPWKQKSSFQVREVVKGNLSCTNEGGMLHNFVHEISSIREQQAKIDGCVAVSDAPVSLGVGADYSRSLNTAKREIGKRVVTKTIAFSPKFDYSEDRLLEYVQDYTGIDSIIEENSKAIEDHFYNFVQHYRITHYVSSVTLGASTFMVDDEFKFFRQISSRANIGYDPAAKVSGTVSLRKRQNDKSMDVKSIGKLCEDGTVEKEAVIKVKIEPISYLLKTVKLREPMKNALLRYMQGEQRSQDGPYLITCNDSKLFLQVDTEQELVYATDNEEEASQFYIRLTDEGDHPNLFYIGWKPALTRSQIIAQDHQATPYQLSRVRLQSTDPFSSRDDDNTGLLKQEDCKATCSSTMRFLCAPLNFQGKHRGPLPMKTHYRAHHCLFSINSRLINRFHQLQPQNLNPEVWLKGEESFLIRCPRRSHRDGFIAVKMRENPLRNGPQFKTAIQPHARRDDVYMSFRLQRPRIPNQERRYSV